MAKPPRSTKSSTPKATPRPRTPRNIDFQPRTQKQRELVEATKHHSIVFATGPAGVGKSLVLVACAIQNLINHEVERIVITRPIIEAAEDNLGFLPGTLEEKVDPYLVPIKDGLNKFLGIDFTETLFASGKISVVPLAYMRGRSIEDSVIICDEGQNATFEGLHMLLTRIGKNSSLYINGDLGQVDLRPYTKSGLQDVMSALHDVPDVAFVRFSTDDCQRNPVVAHVVKALDKFRSHKSDTL